MAEKLAVRDSKCAVFRMKRREMKVVLSICVHVGDGCLNFKME